MSRINISDYSLGARWIHTMTGPPRERHFVNVSGGRIESFSAKPAFDVVYGDDPGDGCAILPGTVNMHAHLELSQLEKPLDVSPGTGKRRPMADWIARLLQFRRSEQYDASAAIETALLRPEILSESVAVADIVPPNVDAERIMKPRLPVWCRFPELIAWTKEQTDAIWRRLPSGAFGFSPHAPQTVCPMLLEQAVETAIPLAMHLAETPEEIQFLQTRDGPLLDLMRRADPDYDPRNVLLGGVKPSRPMDYLQRLSEAPKAFVIHGNYLDDEELEFLADRRETMSVVYCPRSHAWFGHAPYPLKKMLDRGVRVLLGTDSPASTPDLSIINEIRFALKRHPDILPETLFRMATAGGAEALGLDAEFGTLEEGKAARFSFFY